LENRLGVQLRGDQVGLHEHDATALAPLDGYAVGATLLERIRAGMGVDESRRLTVAQGALPRGQLGNYEHARMEETARSIAAIAHGLVGSLTPAQVALRVDVASFTIEGTVGNVYASKRIHVQFSRLRGRGLLPHWVEHLLLSAHTGDTRLTTWLVGRDEEKNEPSVARFDPVACPLEELDNLLRIFELGCRVPIPLFPDLAFTFAQNPKASDYVWEKGWTELLNQEEVTRRVYGQHSHLLLDRPMVSVAGVETPTFEEVSQRVFTPLVRHYSTPTWREFTNPEILGGAS
jgi:exonuclease V gamma subunit